MNFRTLGILAFCLALLGGIAFIQWIQTTQNNSKTIAILQTASHPALDAVKAGFIEELYQLLPACKIIIHNGQGSVDQLHIMAKSIACDPYIDAIIAIATPAAQAIAHVEHEKPIIIAAVTDPQAAGIVQPNVCGLLDMIDCHKELKLIKTLVPRFKKMAILYTTGEINALSLVDAMKKICKQENIVCHDICIAHETDILLVLEQAYTCDVIWAPLDNTIASSISLITNKTLQAHKPFFVSDNLLVSEGALAAAGVDYNKSGKEVAHIAMNLLSNKKPHEILFKKPTIDAFWINKKTMNQLGLPTPKVAEIAIEWVGL